MTDDITYEIVVKRTCVSFVITTRDVMRRDDLVSLLREKFPAEEGREMTVNRVVPPRHRTDGLGRCGP